MATNTTKDLYRILRVTRTATADEIKHAYRRLALELHPDRHDGCESKTSSFKDASEAYDVLGDASKRRAYDHSSRNPYTINQHPHRKRNVSNHRPLYRKVYASRPLRPGEKVFDNERHYRMHYGDGIMEEEIEKMKKKNSDAGFRGGGTWHKGEQRDKQGFSEQYAYFSTDEDSRSLSKAKNILSQKDLVKKRMAERREGRLNRQKEGSKGGHVCEKSTMAFSKPEADGCVLM